MKTATFQSSCLVDNDSNEPPFFLLLHSKSRDVKKPGRKRDCSRDVSTAAEHPSGVGAGLTNAFLSFFIFQAALDLYCSPPSLFYVVTFA